MIPDSLFDLLNFSLDHHLNPYIPPNPISHLPKPISRFLGHRPSPPKDAPPVLEWFLTVPATIAGICAAGAIYNYAPGLTDLHSPPIIASLGASAILYYSAINVPLAQPRNAVIGHTLAAIVGVGISKLFQLNPVFFANYDWVPAAVACAAAGLVMNMTNSVHPPGGATAILACSEARVIAIGWWFPVVILVGTLVMLGVALLFNNTVRRYPTYWWTGEEVGGKLPLRRNRERMKAEKENVEKIEKDLEKGELNPPPLRDPASKDTLASDGADSQRTLTREASQEIWHLEGLEAIHIAPHRIMLPANVNLRGEEAQMLLSLMKRLSVDC